MTAIAETFRASSVEAARTRADRIRIGISAYVTTMEDIAAAYAERDWVALDYPSWEAYVDGEYSEARLKLSADRRREAVTQLRLAGLSTRAIGSVLGVDDKTVRNDIAATAENSAVELPTRIISRDGRERPATQPARPEIDEVSSADAIDDVPLWDDEPAAEPEPTPDPAQAAVHAEFRQAVRESAGRQQQELMELIAEQRARNAFDEACRALLSALSWAAAYRPPADADTKAATFIDHAKRLTEIVDTWGEQPA